MRKNFDLDKGLVAKINAIIKATKPKYNSFTHFVEIALNDLVIKETEKESEGTS